MKFKLYIAHPITGLSGREVIDYFNKVSGIFKDQFKILSPLSDKEHLYNDDLCQAHGYKDAVCNDHAIFQRDTWMVSQSDIVLCDLSGSTFVSIGCCMELAIASHLHKHTIVIMDRENIHRHSFVLDAADIIFEDFNSAVMYLSKL